VKYVPKEDIVNYPLIQFNGKVHVVDHVESASKACKRISKVKIIGFDTETKPSFKKGVSYNVSLLQISAGDDVFLFRLDKIGLQKDIIDLLSSSTILKVGIDIKNDIIGLKKLHPFEISNFLDLNNLATEKGYQSIGAIKLCIMLLGYRISKNQRLSDWSAENLTEAQLQYAAIDAWICPKILQAFRDISLYP
tara:strand:+ start:994 stop:1572 length:579 start_codon:yes stop_codon:yes gene_type:complete